MPKKRKGLLRDPTEAQIARFEDMVNENHELLHTDKLPASWEKLYGTDDGKIARHRHKKLALIRDIIADQNHHELFFDAIKDLQRVDVTDTEGNPGLEIQKQKALAELHLKAMGKYLPDVKAVTIDVSEDTKAVAEGVSKVAELLAAIAPARSPGDDARLVQEGSVVSSQIHDEEEGP